jgi:hypothetical protein
MQMKKFKIEFSLTLIPTLAVIMSATLVTIFSTTMNIANADSFPFLPQSPSLQSHPQPPQQQQQNQPTQQPLQTNGTDNNDNKLDNHSPSIVSILPF